MKLSLIHRLLVAAIVAVGLHVEGSAQAPSFEVASVKPNNSGSRRTNFAVTPGRFTATNVNVLQMISMAYSDAGALPAGTIIGAPGWLRTDHFDILAKVDAEPPLDQLRLMVRALLADRFQLRLRPERKERPIYALTVARRGGSPGPRVRRADAVCPGDPGTDQTPPRPASGGAEAAPCQLRYFPGKLSGRSITMERLATALINAVDDHREVRNQTALEGRFDVDLDWMPDTALPLAGRDADAPPLPPIDPNAPSLFTAVQEQLGLKLEAQKDSVEVLVIEQVERPTID